MGQDRKGSGIPGNSHKVTDGTTELIEKINQISGVRSARSGSNNAGVHSGAHPYVKITWEEGMDCIGVKVGNSHGLQRISVVIDGTRGMKDISMDIEAVFVEAQEYKIRNFIYPSDQRRTDEEGEGEEMTNTPQLAPGVLKEEGESLPELTPNRAYELLYLRAAEQIGVREDERGNLILHEVGPLDYLKSKGYYTLSVITLAIKQLKEEGRLWQEWVIVNETPPASPEVRAESPAPDELPKAFATLFLLSQCPSDQRATIIRELVYGNSSSFPSKERVEEAGRHLREMAEYAMKMAELAPQLMKEAEDMELAAKTHQTWAMLLGHKPPEQY